MVELRGVAKSFRGPAPRRIFDDLSLTIAPGEYVAVVGASGVGKSTLLNVIAGLEPVDAGQVIVDGVDCAKLGDEAIRIVDSFGLEAIKTQEVAGVLIALKATGRVLVVAPAADERLRLSARNLPSVDVILADSLNVVDVLNADTVVIEQPALARMEEVYL